MSPRCRAALAGLALAACASGPVEPEIDLTPWAWTWSQTALGAYMIRYGFPDEPPAPGEATALVEAPVGRGLVATRFASHRYGCAGQGREEEAPCSVFLDFWLLELGTPLADDTLATYQERFERLYPAPPVPGRRLVSDLARDSRGREWYHRSLTLASGGAFAHYSRPIDARYALAVTSSTTRAPDRVAARDLARDVIDRVWIEAVR